MRLRRGVHDRHAVIYPAYKHLTTNFDDAVELVGAMFSKVEKFEMRMSKNFQSWFGTSGISYSPQFLSMPGLRRLDVELLQLDEKWIIPVRAPDLAEVTTVRLLNLSTFMETLPVSASRQADKCPHKSLTSV